MASFSDGSPSVKVSITSMCQSLEYADIPLLSEIKKGRPWQNRSSVALHEAS